MASDWMFNNGLDDDSDVGSSPRMSRKEAKEILRVSEHHYGGYCYDYEDRKRAREVLGK